MHALALALALAAPDGASPAAPAAAPVAVTDAIAIPVPPPPALVSMDPGAAASPPPPAVTPATGSPPAPAAAPSTVPLATTPSAAPTATPVSPPPVPLPQAAVEKLGQGDRAFLERDYRGALFAYQDAVYLAPRSPRARVKLGRAYLALRYPVQAIAQAEQALAADPGNGEALQLLEEARNPAPRPTTVISANGRVTPPQPDAVAPKPAHPQPLVYRFVPEPGDERPRTPAPGMASAPPASAPPTRSREGAPPPEPKTIVAVRTEVVSAAAVAPTLPAPSAAQRYREGVALLGERRYERAAAALTEAIDLDPRLAVAHAARGSARVGLGRHRDAADDYRAALDLDPGLATPLYGLAECHRVLGDARAASDMYRRYAQSRAADVREDLRAIAAKRAEELRP
jgi:tetratricopeptide (TPR) repeat protein